MAKESKQSVTILSICANLRKAKLLLLRLGLIQQYYDLSYKSRYSSKEMGFFNPRSQIDSTVVTYLHTKTFRSYEPQ